MPQHYRREVGRYPIKQVKRVGNSVEFAQTTPMDHHRSLVQVLDLVQTSVEIMTLVQIIRYSLRLTTCLWEPAQDLFGNTGCVQRMVGTADYCMSLLMVVLGIKHL